MVSDNEITTVPLEDWYEELADEQLDPLNILINEEDTDMSTTTLHMNKSTAGFDVKKWIATANAITSAPKTSVVPTPEWLTLAHGVVSRENAFTVTAGVIKAARQVLDAIAYTERERDELVERLTVQEQRATQTTKVNRVTGEIKDYPHDVYSRIDQDDMTVAMQLNGETDTSNDRVFSKGKNPNGYEYDAAVAELVEAIDKLESVLDNGYRIIGDIHDWIRVHAEDLELKVQTGYTVTKGPIGNDVRKPKYELLTPDTLMYGVALQRDFIRANRG